MLAESTAVPHLLLRHVVLFAFKNDAPADAVDAVVAGFAKLPDAIPGIVGYETGTNVSPEGLNDGYTHCFMLTFSSAEARDDYLNHPAHVRFVKTLASCLERSLVIDYWAQQRPGPEEEQARILASVS
ncbi:Dabb family protein [Pseudoduganella umbonata]|uniref:Dabb family protein n=1 Tax=Pseudoduganella umbonata TaxID=864828 RepID=A0A4P8HRD5_9BURK|nr:Dabb family protein [Pseudoduganella umbonata]MBB3224877.1 quinol monooxygenase YgiN [Pseudoduganella umbonata]QCP11178.1 Dabb family protein [Pseudoduganella umbonata]